MQNEYELPDGLTIRVVPATVPTTADPFHPTATHVDALGMPVAGVDGFPYHPTPCCGASASISDGPMYCKGCYEEVDYAFGNVPLQPFRLIAQVDRVLAARAASGRVTPEVPKPLEPRG